MGLVTGAVAAVTVVVVAVAAVVVAAAAAAAVPVAAADVPAVAVPAAAVPAVAAAVADWMCVSALQTQVADARCQMEAEPADLAVLAPGREQHAQQAELQVVQGEGQGRLDQWADVLLGEQS